MDRIPYMSPRGPVKRPEDVYCVGCGARHKASQSRTGRVRDKVRFIKRDVNTLVWDPTLQRTVEEVVQKNLPIGGWKRGNVCPDCQADYSTRTFVSRSGEVKWEANVKLDPSSTERVTLNPGEGFQVPERIKHQDGFGEQQVLTRKRDLIDGACYNRFTR